MNGGGPPVIVMNTNMERQSGHKAQLSNIQAAKVRKSPLFQASLWNISIEFRSDHDSLFNFRSLDH